MNALRLFINGILEEEEVNGCVVHTDIFHKKIQKMAADMMTEDYKNERVKQGDVDDLLIYITYCHYDYEMAEYSEELKPPLHVANLGRSYIRKAITSFLEDIRD